MKIIKYKFKYGEINHGTEEQPELEPLLREKEIRCAEADLAANEEIAKAEAYKGEYTIEDDGQPEPVAEPTTDDILNAMLGVNRYA